MRRYAIRRILSAVTALFLVSLFAAGFPRLVPVGPPLVWPAGHVPPWPVVESQIRAELGLDRPFHLQYGDWIADVFTGDFGPSFGWGGEVSEIMATTAPVTVELVALALVTALVLAVPAGIWLAFQPRGPCNRSDRLSSSGGLGVPEFVSGALAVLLGVIWFKWAPSSTYVGFLDDPIGNLKVMVPAALAIGVPLSVVTLRLLRSAILGVLQEDYVRTALAKGLKQRVIVVRHVLRNALSFLLPAVVGLLSLIFSGALVVEHLFGLPGLGRELVAAFGDDNRLEWPLVRAALFVIPGSFVVIGLVVDLLHAWIDPRIRHPAPAEAMDERGLAARAATACKSRSPA